MSRFLILLLTVVTILLPGLLHASSRDTVLVISVADQKLGVVRADSTVATYKISTSKFGLGDGFGSYRTPLGTHAISQKIGRGLRSGAVLKGRVPTGEILRPNAPGRDPIVTRILVLRGLEEKNRNATSRGIYIHGTTDEKQIGRPASYGCIRMKSEDVISVFGLVNVGTKVLITQEKLKTACKQLAASRARQVADGSGAAKRNSS